MRWDDKWVWVTGASSGIGAALAECLARRGARLVLSARREDALCHVRNRCAHPDRHRVLPLDLEQPDSLPATARTLLDEIGRLDVLVNNAGISQRSLARDTLLDVDRRIMELNYFAVVALTKAVLPSMIAARGGHLVTVSSLAGKLSTPQRSAYAASKHAVHGFMDALRAEVHPYGIRVTVVCPGYVRTELSRAALTGDGAAHRAMDRAQERGMSPERCAARIARAVERERDEVIIAGAERLAWTLRKWAPGLYNRLIRHYRTSSPRAGAAVS
jgi:short-subunit dehydrogenase